MHFETRLWQFTKGVRLRMVSTVLNGLVAECFGIARLALLGWLDLPVAIVMLVFALIALFAPAIWHQLDTRKSLDRRVAYGAFAAELLDSIQGLATLKAFGQSKPRAESLAVRARELFRSTM